MTTSPMFCNGHEIRIQSVESLFRDSPQSILPYKITHKLTKE